MHSPKLIKFAQTILIVLHPYNLTNSRNGGIQVKIIPKPKQTQNPAPQSPPTPPCMTQKDKTSDTMSNFNAASLGNYHIKQRHIVIG